MMSASLLAALVSALATWWLVPPVGLARLGRGGRRPPSAERGPAHLVSVVGARSGSEAWGGGVLASWLGAIERGLVAVRARVSRAETRRRRECETSVPAVCELLAICIAAGAPPRGALAVVAESLGGVIGTELTQVAKRIELGVDEPEAWLTLQDTPGYRAVARDIARTVGSGAGLEALLRRHAEDALRDVESAAMTHARGAGVQAVIPLVLCFLPAFGLVGVVPALVSVVLSLLH